MFAGSPPAVDRWLEHEGRLRRLEDPVQLERLGPRAAEPRTPAELRERGRELQRVFVDATIAAASARGQPR
jgi:hypothetical protein